VVTELIKLANKLDDEKKFNQADSIANYLIEFSKSKALKSSTIDSEIPTKLLMLEKAGVDTKEYFEKFKKNNVTQSDLEEINQKLEDNCPDKKIDKQDTDFHEYVLWMNKESDEENSEDNEDKEKFFTDLRETFINFLVDHVVDDFKKEKKEPLNPENLISYYFKNREEYEKELENYDLMMGQTEGILTDKDFEEELTEEINDNAGEMVRRAE
jgi:hypothetical protein